MKYVSTRGAAPVLGFGDVLLAGLASDGGLYLPESWPALPPLDEQRQDGPEVAPRERAEAGDVIVQAKSVKPFDDIVRPPRRRIDKTLFVAFGNTRMVEARENLGFDQRTSAPRRGFHRRLHNDAALVRAVAPGTLPSRGSSSRPIADLRGQKAAGVRR